MESRTYVRSPILFYILIDKIIRKCEAKLKRFQIEVSEVFADDIFIAAFNEEKLEANLEVWNSMVTKYEM